MSRNSYTENIDAMGEPVEMLRTPPRAPHITDVSDRQIRDRTISAIASAYDAEDEENIRREACSYNGD